jgi:translation initiation factor 1
MGRRKRERVEVDDGPLTNNPFAALGTEQSLPEDDSVGSAEAREDAGSGATTERTRPALLTGRIVVRREKKGRGGKTVTVVEGVQGPPQARAELLRSLRRALGVGGNVDGERLVLSGADTARVSAWLRDNGAERVVVGN